MSSSSSGRGSMFVPRSTGGRWVLLIIVLWLIWMMINHPSDAVDLFQTIGSGIGQLFTAAYEAYKESRNAP